MDILYKNTALKSLEQFDKKAKMHIKNAIENLPFGDVKKLEGFDNRYRLRKRNFRIFYTIEKDTIVIQDIKWRQSAYKH